MPPEALYDHLIVRAHREDLRRVALASGEDELVLERSDGDWWVRQGERRFPASHGKVEDFLGTLERQELGSYLTEETFRPHEPERRLTIVAGEDLRFEGRVGASARDPRTGAEGWHYLREGDDVPALVGESVVRWFDVPLEEWRRRQIHRYDESLVDSVTLELDGVERSYQRRNGTEWFPQGVPTRLPFHSGFFPVLEALRSLRAESWLTPEDGRELSPSIDVLIAGSFPRGTRSFTLGRTAAGEAVCRLPEGEVAVVDPDLLTGALALFED